MTQSKVDKESTYDEYDDVYEQYGAVDIEHKEVDRQPENKNEEDDEVYEEYAEYRERYISNSKNEQSNCPIFFEKLSKRGKWIIFTFLCSGLIGITVSITVGLAMHFAGSSKPEETTETIKTTTVTTTTTTTLVTPRDERTHI